MEGYCQTTGCLREYILRYFGDEDAAAQLAREAAASATGCGACSNCLGDFAVEDVTEAAREVVRFVAPRADRFGKALLAEALHGANNEKVRRVHLDEVEGYGALHAMPLVHIRSLIDQLVGRGYLAASQGQFPVLSLGPRAVEVLSDEGGAFRFSVKRRAAKRTAPARAQRAVDLLRDEAALDARPRVGDDAELFERLRTLRTELAREHEWAPYMVFSDKALASAHARRASGRVGRGREESRRLRRALPGRDRCLRGRAAVGAGLELDWAAFILLRCTLRDARRAPCSRQG